MTKTFEIRVMVTDEDDTVINKTAFDYDVPDDTLDLEDVMGYVSNDISHVITSYLATP